MHVLFEKIRPNSEANFGEDASGTAEFIWKECFSKLNEQIMECGRYSS